MAALALSAAAPSCASDDSSSSTSSGDGGAGAEGPASSSAVNGSTVGAGGSGGGGGNGSGNGGTGGTGTGGTGGNGTGGTGTGGTGTGGTGTGGTGGQGGASACLPADGAVLAINKLYLGDTNPDDTPNSANGWKQYGFNIDGLVSTAISMDLCQRQQGASPNTAYPDGNNGIDNSFGKNLLPLFKAMTPSFSSDVNEAIAAGDTTLIAHLDGLGAGPDMPSLITRLYGGAVLGAVPKFDGSDCWPVLPDGLADPSDITSSKVVFDQSSVQANAWSSNGTSTVLLDLSIGGVMVRFKIYKARLSMTLDATHTVATTGQLGGVLDTEELVKEVERVVGTFEPTLCDSATMASIANQIRQASDILTDGTQDTTAPCNGISIGLGFTMKQVGLQGVSAPVPPPPDPCP